jgi:DNA-binding CsgD family transcriptional regulator
MSVTPGKLGGTVAAVALRAAEVQRLLHVAGEFADLQAVPGAPADVSDLLTLVGTFVRCDFVTWSRLDQRGRRVIAGMTVPDDPADTDSQLDAFWAYYDEHPLCHGRGARMPVVALSDLTDRRGLRRNRLYAEVLRPSGTEHLIKVDLSHPANETNVLLLDRGPGPDFNRHDHLILALLRPHLDAAVRRLTTSVRLTPREHEVLTLVRDGLTNRSIAGRLQVSEHTIRKHLENLFARLGVHSRTAAVAACAELAATASPPAGLVA